MNVIRIEFGQDSTCLIHGSVTCFYEHGNVLSARIAYVI
jgi:hypothetical protein